MLSFKKTSVCCFFWIVCEIFPEFCFKKTLFGPATEAALQKSANARLWGGGGEGGCECKFTQRALNVAVQPVARVHTVCTRVFSVYPVCHVHTKWKYIGYVTPKLWIVSSLKPTPVETGGFYTWEKKEQVSHRSLDGQAMNEDVNPG